MEKSRSKPRSFHLLAVDIKLSGMPALPLFVKLSVPRRNYKKTTAVWPSRSPPTSRFFSAFSATILTMIFDTSQDSDSQAANFYTVMNTIITKAPRSPPKSLSAWVDERGVWLGVNECTPSSVRKTICVWEHMRWEACTLCPYPREGGYNETL